MIKWGLVLLHFSMQPEAGGTSSMEEDKPKVKSTLDEAALGGSEFPITRSMQAEAGFSLVWGTIHYSRGQFGLKNVPGVLLW